MRMLMHVKLPNQEFNAAARDGTAGAKMKRILDEMQAEAVYFTEYGGQRGAILIVNVADPSKIPGLCEPWFLTFNAAVELHAAMTPEDIGRAGLDELGKKWG